jgi:hypothetical protein
MADGPIAEELLWRAEPCQESSSKRTDRYRIAELVSILEEIRHGLRHAVDAHRYPLVGVVLDSFRECGSREADDAKWRLLPAWASSFFTNGEEHLWRLLG